jgi:uncharacterized membrane protein YcaP (DUF421 family)
MISKIIESFEIIIGLEHWNLVLGMSVRGIILYTLSIMSIRLNKKFLGIRTSYSFILYVMLGSLCAAAITEEGLFLPITSTILVLSLINRVMSSLFFHHSWLETVFLGSPVLLVSNGELQRHNMRSHFVTTTDLSNALQTQLHTNDLGKVDSAYLATDGTINFITKS